MNIRRVSALSKKEIIQVLRDPRSLNMAIVLPVILLTLFGSALTLDVDNIPLVIWNQDKSQISRDFILNFRNSRYFKIVGYCDNYAILQGYIDRNNALMALVIPRDFSRLMQSNRAACVQIIVDGSDSNTATIALGYVNAIVSGYTTAREPVIPVDFRPRIWFNENLKSRNFIIPGLIAIIMAIIAALLTSVTVAREWERGTMEQLISTPITSGELIFGKFIPYFAIGFIDFLIAIGMSRFIFNVPFKGNIILLFFSSCLFLTGALMLGMYISVISKSQRLANQLAILSTFLPTFLLSGFIYPIYNMPKAIQAITYFIPATYFIIILKGIYLKGVGIDILWPQILFLFLFACGMVFLSNRNFTKKIFS